MILEIHSKKPRQIIDITDEVGRRLPDGSGLASVFIAHTTASITTADLDPGTDEDLLDALHGMLPKQQWCHPHDPAHAPSHLLSSIVGPGVVIPYSSGDLRLGTWQRIILVEFDGPRTRTVELNFAKE